MLAEAADKAGRDSVEFIERIAATVPAKQALRAMLEAYLSKTHLEGIETGCATAALGSEMPRQAPEVRRAATRHIKAAIDVVARQLPDWGQPGAHERALVTVATMVGALVLARAVDDPRLSDALRKAALNHCSSSKD
jgi:AcrR family transcriptional regulator